ncbi:unnamed protein product [Prorocentrum cordatum]|uniref:Uncharacterized protein n=1 Tax=Prorocentrum cordatum TaxID=2364126 RepID=A0ABN9W197_9DINO|nr:unnamed protein product [Polarella glacialis]
MAEAELLHPQVGNASPTRLVALDPQARFVEGSHDGGAGDLSPAHKSKARWRRQNSDILAQRRASRAVGVLAAKPHQDGHRSSWRRFSRKGQAKKDDARRRREAQEDGAREPKGSKARWETPTSDWCREVLHLEMVAATSSDDPCRRESAPDVLPCGDAAGGCPLARAGRSCHAAAAFADAPQGGAQPTGPLGAAAGCGPAAARPQPCPPPAPEGPPKAACAGTAGVAAGARAGILRECGRAEGAPCVRRLPRPPCADAATQCDAEDMVELIWKSQLGRKQNMAKLKEGANMGAPIPYSVAAHFSLFLDPSSLAEEASRLDDAQLDALADRFLGDQIAGVAIVPKERRRPRLVPGRHAVEASLLAQRAPQFRTRLLLSSRRLLLGSARGGGPPLHGRSLLRLADEQPGRWARLAHTALNFACRLIQAGALPRALTAEIVEALGELSPMALVLGLSTVLGHAPSAVGGCASACPPPPARPETLHVGPPQRISLAEAGRAATEPAAARAPAPTLLARTQSTPAEFWVARRHVGTSLRPHAAESQQLKWGVRAWVHHDAMITLPDQRKAADTIPIEVAPQDVPAYWRCAAGGEHSPAELEARARRAEEALSAVAAAGAEGTE